MRSSRRSMLCSAALFPAALAASTLACSAAAVASPWPEAEGGPLDLTLEQRRQACPLCRPGQYCAEHLV